MKKRLIATFLIISSLLTATLFTLASCSKKADDSKDIQLWTYDYETNSQLDNKYFIGVKSLISGIKNFCAENEIPINIVTYDSKTLSYEDYVLKRNIAAAKGNMIIIEDSRYLHDISEHHADYTKLKNYNMLLDSYKDKFCIPIGINHCTIIVNRSILDFYGIEPDKSLITYEEYLEIKQSMKDKGARFYTNQFEYSERIDYYANKYDLSYINDASEVIDNKDKFKASLKSVILGVCDEFIKYNNSELDIIDYENQKYIGIYDENSELNMYFQSEARYISAIPLANAVNKKYNYITDDNNLSVAYPKAGLSPSFYIYKKITNEKIYEVANFILREESFKAIDGSSKAYLPSLKGEITRQVLELDEDYNYSGIHEVVAKTGNEYSSKISKLINEAIEIHMKNNETSKLLASYYFANKEYSRKIYDFIMDKVKSLSENNFDYKNEKINNELNKQIDEFIKDFNIHYK